VLGTLRCDSETLSKTSRQSGLRQGTETGSTTNVGANGVMVQVGYELNELTLITKISFDRSEIHDAV
jgi:hypothetical protein